MKLNYFNMLCKKTSKQVSRHFAKGSIAFKLPKVADTKLHLVAILFFSIFSIN